MFNSSSLLPHAPMGREKRNELLGTIVFTLLVGSIIGSVSGFNSGLQTAYSATGTQNSLSEDWIETESANFSRYYLDDTNITDRLTGDWGSTNLSTTGSVNTADLNFTSEFYYNSENRTGIIEGDFTGIGLETPWLDLGGDNRTTWPSGVGLDQYPFSYIVFTNATGYYAINCSTGQIEFSGADADNLLNSACGAAEDGSLFITAGIYPIDTAITVPADVWIYGDGNWATRIRIDADVSAFIFSSVRSGMSHVGIYPSINETYGLDTPLIRVDGSWNTLYDIRLYRNANFLTRGIGLQYWAPDGSNNGIGYCIATGFTVDGPFSKGLHLFNNGTFPNEWINANDYSEIMLTFDGADNTTAVHVEKLGTGEVASNRYDGVKTQNCDVNYLIEGASTQEFFFIETWDSPADAISINVTSGSTGNLFLGGFISRTVVIDGTDTQIIHVDGYEGDLLPAITVPFSDGTEFDYTSTGPSGRLVDAQNEYAWSSVIIPNNVKNIVEIRIYAISNITEVHGMNMKFQGYAATDNEAYNTETLTITRESNSTNFAQNDVVFWAFTAADEEDLDDIQGGDVFQFWVRGWLAAGDHCATNGWFLSAKIYYINR
jgi:hypothetical protein